ncbi:CPBP family intramembrane glutamic endopeptidase [Sphingobium nicotianae]|uniref:CPBP family intramembrane metalloprotease n=1 Tax=Sphingobium nicotianae TaxID=2782607 RepID=A0A9X1IQH8_9SPHN|nr:CPBP family intramembrane glutamic endopeptidase [Sphingobium nicotianae]MBT2186717.1 CPBP family intramembrane metalloprotease [Sphingobium nicotianae]
MVVIGSAGVLAPGKWRWLRALGWLVVLCVGTVILYNAVARGGLWLAVRAGGIRLDSLSAAPAAYKLVVAIIGLLAVLIAYRATIRFGERRATPELGLRRAPWELLAGLIIGGALLGAIVGVQWLFGWVIITPKPIDGVALALRDSLRSGVLEELVMRLVIFRLLWRAFGIWPALAGAAVVFGLLHLANPDASLFAVACLIAGEGAIIALYMITGRAWASMGMHAGWNFTQGWRLGAAVSGTGEIAGGPLALRPAAHVSELLSGGGFGPEASLSALVLSLLASAALLWWAWARGDFVASDA